MRASARTSRRGSPALLVTTMASLLIAACSGGGGTAVPGASSTPGASVGAYPDGALSIMAPAAPGGGWDSTARAMQKAVSDAKLTTANVEVYNVAGAGGTVGLAQFAEQKKGDPESLMVMGLVMIGAIATNKSAVDLTTVTPIASLTAEYEAIVVKADSKYKTLQDLVTDFKANPKSISWGGGSAGGTDHILVGLLAKAAAVDPAGINYIAHSGGGEAIAAILSGAVTAGVSGISEFKDQVAAGKMRYLAVSADAKVAGVEAPTIKEAGFEVSIANWRGVVAPPGLSTAQRDAVVAFVDKLHASKPWTDTVAANGWTDFYKTGDAFKTYLDEQRTTVEATLKDIGLVQ